MGRDAVREDLTGDASYRGIGNEVAARQQPTVAIDSAGHPYVAWTDVSSGSPEIYLRGNTFTISRVFYVNDGFQRGDSSRPRLGRDQRRSVAEPAQADDSAGN